MWSSVRCSMVLRWLLAPQARANGQLRHVAMLQALHDRDLLKIISVFSCHPPIAAKYCRSYSGGAKPDKQAVRPRGQATRPPRPAAESGHQG